MNRSSGSADRRLERQQRERVRLIYSLRDFQLALSAAAFLAECEPDGSYSKVDLRRFRCYETEMIISYTRPFSMAKGEIPALTLKMSGAQLHDKQKHLHETQMVARNKVVAHSDGDMMRVLSTTAAIDLNGFKFTFVETVFDDGLNFIGDAVRHVTELVALIRGTIHQKVLREAQEHPENFEFRRDYLIE